ncbi:MAG: hypothetical protein AB8G22_28470 [Saprospiraceae bacterium]
MRLHENLTDLHRDCWNLLFRAAVQRRHEMHTPVLATTKYESLNIATAAARTVVLRTTEVEKRQLTFYTDFRSPKVAELQWQPRHIWHFYDNGQKVQMRITADAIIQHQNDRTRTIWQNIPPKNRKDYCATQPPGSPIEDPQAATPDFFIDGEPTTENTDYGYENFVVVDAQVLSIDWLHLHREGHQRAQLVWQGKEWEMNWLVP